MKNGGVNISVILFLIFMTLKLTGYIDWSWWWVTAPLWILLALIGVFATLAILILAAANKLD